MQDSRQSNPTALNEASGVVKVKTETSGGVANSTNVGFVSPTDIVDELDNGSVQITTTIGSGVNKRTEVMTLPLPPGTLPPRKRARTKDEKEQRRIERIMRNRQAAHASREKKRKHVEDLENRCKTLTTRTQELEDKLKLTQRSQMHTQEQYCMLRSRLEQLEAAVQLAKSSGDILVLDTVPSDSTSSNFAILPPLVGQDACASPKECASPESLQLGVSVPSLSHSTSNSPAAIDEEDGDMDGLHFPFSSVTAMTPTSTHTTTQTQTHSHHNIPFDTVGDVAFLDSSSKAHHPAAMMSLTPLASPEKYGVCASQPIYLSRALLPAKNPLE